MNVLFLSAVHAHGFLWLTLLFAACFLLVHALRLIALGKKYQRQCKAQQNAPPEQTKAPPQNEQEPVYYIVEKKRKTKTDYSLPKQIKFK